MVVGFHSYGGHGEVCAVDCNDGGLGETGSGVDILDGGVDRYHGRSEKKQEVDL
jgi:hypothetical protein